MRLSHNPQRCLFESDFSKHIFAHRLRDLSSLLDLHPHLITMTHQDLTRVQCQATGRNGLSAENLLRALILKQSLGFSYEQLAFHLSDSACYRSFVRLNFDQYPSRSALQAGIRQIRAETMQAMALQLVQQWHHDKVIDFSQLRIDSTVVKSNIAAPSDSQMLADGIRVLSRHLAKLKHSFGVTFRFWDQRKKSKSLAFRIFNAKKAEKEKLYPELLHLASVVEQQAQRGLELMELVPDAETWVDTVNHYRCLLNRVIDQTTRRVIYGEKVPSSEKLVSLFEPHTDVIVKGFRDIQYGHKINLATDLSGFITYCQIEDGNPSDSSLYQPVVKAHLNAFGQLPGRTVADGGYASRENVEQARNLGVKGVAFSKRVGLKLSEMGLKQKTFDKLKKFRAGIEGNISELKRAFGVGKVTWKQKDGFDAYVWASILSYNLMRRIRLASG